MGGSFLQGGYAGDDRSVAVTTSNFHLQCPGFTVIVIVGNGGSVGVPPGVGETGGVSDGVGVTEPVGDGLAVPVGVGDSTSAVKNAGDVRLQDVPSGVVKVIWISTT